MTSGLQHSCFFYIALCASGTQKRNTVEWFFIFNSFWPIWQIVVHVSHLQLIYKFISYLLSGKWCVKLNPTPTLATSISWPLFCTMKSGPSRVSDETYLIDLKGEKPPTWKVRQFCRMTILGCACHSLCHSKWTELSGGKNCLGILSKKNRRRDGKKKREGKFPVFPVPFYCCVHAWNGRRVVEPCFPLDPVQLLTACHV